MAKDERNTIEFEQGWEFIQKAITTLKNILERPDEQQFSPKDHNILYKIMYDIDTSIQNPPHDYLQWLYDKYRETIEEYITSTVLPSLMEKCDEFMLRELVKRWVNHQCMVKWLRKFLYFLDCYFTAPKSVPPLNEVGYACFNDLVYQEINVRARDVVITLIDKEREGEKIDRVLVKNVLDIFVKIGMGQMDCYENDFEKAMLKDTAAYYSRKVSSWISVYSCPDYLVEAEKCLESEKERVSHYLQSRSEPKLLDKVRTELLLGYANQLLENKHFGCRKLPRDDKVEDLSTMYRHFGCHRLVGHDKVKYLSKICMLFSEIPQCLELVSDRFKQHIIDEGTALVEQAKDAASDKKVLVRKVIELHDKYLVYVNDCFMSNTLFHKALKEAFEDFCNKGVAGSTSAELLATFCDNILKKGGSEKLSDEAIEETLEKVVKFLAYISDKDLFAEFFRTKLARRLLFDNSVNHDHERSILTKLKQQCGKQFTSKMDEMVTDMTLVGENRAHFEEYLGNNPNANPGIDLTVAVIKNGFWPNYKSFDLDLPAEMVKCVEIFQEFYQTKMKYRKLTWIYSLGNCNIIGNFEPKTMELNVTTSQASALMLFNASDRLSFSEIMNNLNLTEDDLVQLLHSLSCVKYKILNKEPNTKTISPSDYFEFNSKFTDKKKRIMVPLPPVEEENVEEEKVIKDVDRDRRYAIDAALIRIMKSRQNLGHPLLVKECSDHLGRIFKPDLTFINKRIEDLITREYIRRDTDNPALYWYVP